ncbi:MAG TPA: sulfur oxidation c-type cytochrome SoxX [Burkholderiales bacterium]|nr:sulfur oxidation c-type cytochrome SoxX [Burkholderiales bacterium]
MKPKTILALALCSIWVAGCATRPSDSEAERAVAEMIKTSFKTRGQATIARLNQDDAQALCSKYRGELPKGVSDGIEKTQQETIRYPGSGKLMGDWREGERIAQSGVGRQFTDAPTRPAGGSCYNCHQLSKQELSFGTIGPSLYQFGKQRGASEAIQKYAYGKIYNSEASTACSNMPRFGYNGVLTEEQITHLVALLLDPESPVNK